MVSNYLVKFLEEKEVPTITKKRHTYLTYYGLEQQDTYVLKEGIVKTSIILRDGREFNISYIKGPDIISLLKDEVSQYTSAPFNVRIESETATFYRIPRVLFWDFVNQDPELKEYVNSYYRTKLTEAIFRQHCCSNSLGFYQKLRALLFNFVSKFLLPKFCVNTCISLFMRL